MDDEGCGCWYGCQRQTDGSSDLCRACEEERHPVEGGSFGSDDLETF